MFPSPKLELFAHREIEPVGAAVFKGAVLWRTLLLLQLPLLQISLLQIQRPSLLQILRPPSNFGLPEGKGPVAGVR